MASVRPLCGEAGPAGARAVLCPSPRGLRAGGQRQPCELLPAGRPRVPLPWRPSIALVSSRPTAPAGARRRRDGTAPQGLGSPQGPGTSGSGVLRHSGPILSRTLMNLCFYATARRAAGRVVCVCLGGGVPSGVEPSVCVR